MTSHAPVCGYSDRVVPKKFDIKGKIGKIAHTTEKGPFRITQRLVRFLDLAKNGVAQKCQK